MSLLSAHLEQISYSCQGVDALPFPPPKIFTNALLANHDITSLIRDTEPHERALFSAPPPPPSASLRAAEPDDPKVTHRRQTVFNVALGEVTAGPPGRRSSHYPRRHTAVAAVLGGEMHEQIRDRRGDLDVEVLLRGAEKLCGVYELPGTRERIAALRDKHRRGMNTAAYYEAKVAEQAEQLAGMKKGWIDDDDNDDNHDQQQCMQDPWGMNGAWTDDGLRREEEETREMEAKKKELQTRLLTVEKDLGGLMNIM